jgi:endonuclease-3
MKTRKRTRAEEALNRILLTSERTWTPSQVDPFKTLIRTILSQNTNWRNEDTAYRRLEELIGVTPKKLASTPLNDIAEAIKPAGMYNIRSRVIKQVSEQVLDRFGGDLTSTVSKPYPDAREALMTLSGVGEKTADVVLLFNAGKSVIPVDRHIARISKKLELVPAGASYDAIRHTLEEATRPENFLDAHIKLIQFGRDTCRAQKPRCLICNLRDICPHPIREAAEQPQADKQPQLKPKNPKQTK